MNSPLFSLRGWIVASILSLGSTSAMQAAASTAASASKHPNVLLIVVDDLNTSLGCYGNAVVKSPAIDRLAARGTRFDSAHCQYPLCNPSRVSFLSGRRPETSGVYILGTPARTALPNAVMLPQFFRQRGYFSAGAGKVFHSLKTSDPASWDSYEDGTGEDPGERAAIEARYGGGDGTPRSYVLTGDGSRTRDGLNARTIGRFLEEKSAAGQPFFLAAGFHKPHLPWTAPKKFFDLYPEDGVPVPAEPALRDVPTIALQTELSGFAQPESRGGAIRGYYACISFTDSLIGRLLDQLDQRKLWDNTVVVLLGDNGFHLGDHGGLWAKLSAFDASTRVPLIIAGPDVPAGRVISTPVELLDVYPTLAELAGFPPPPGLEGESLVSLTHGHATAPHRPAASLTYHYDVVRKKDVAGRTVIAEQWRYTEWDGGRAGRELYWHPDDPGEYRNRVADPGLGAAVRTGEEFLRAAPTPKPGPANRPRAIDPDAKKKK